MMLFLFVVYHNTNNRSTLLDIGCTDQKYKELLFFFTAQKEMDDGKSDL